jgi:hypothetical protein
VLRAPLAHHGTLGFAWGLLRAVAVMVAFAASAPVASASRAPYQGTIFAIEEELSNGCDECDQPGATYFVWRGTAQRPFRKLRGLRVDNQPAISPDGRLVAYVGWPQANVYVRSINPRTNAVGPRRLLIRLPAIADRAQLDSAFFPDGHSLALLGMVEFGASASELAWTVGLDGSNLRQLPIPSSLFGWGPVWSSRHRLAFDAQGTIYTLGDDGSDIDPIPDQGYDNHDLLWTPDGRLLFLRGGLELMSVDADGQHLRQLHRWSRFRDAMALAPDGRHLALLVRGERHAHVEITHPDGTHPHRLELRRPLPASGLAWTTG